MSSFEDSFIVSQRHVPGADGGDGSGNLFHYFHRYHLRVRRGRLGPLAVASSFPVDTSNDK